MHQRHRYRPQTGKAAAGKRKPDLARFQVRNNLLSLPQFPGIGLAAFGSFNKRPSPGKQAPQGDIKAGF